MPVSFALLGLAGMLVLPACSTPSPEPALRSARYAVQRAEDADARRYAAGDLARARDQLRDAETASQERSGWIDARRLAEKALVDAEVAAARAATEQLRITADQLGQSLREADGTP